MWGSLGRAVIGVPILGFMMWVTYQVVDPINTMAQSGPNSGHQSVGVIGGWFDLMTVSNMTLVAGFGLVAYLLGRSVVERRGV